MFYNQVGNNCIYNSALINNNWPNQFSNSIINENNGLDEKKIIQKCNIKDKILKNNQKKFTDSQSENIENQKNQTKKILNITTYETNDSIQTNLSSYNIHNPSTSGAIFTSNSEDNILNNQLSTETKDRTFVCEWVTVSFFFYLFLFLQFLINYFFFLL